MSTLGQNRTSRHLLGALFFLGCRTTRFLFLFLFAAPLGASFLTVATPLVTPLHPLRLRSGICCRQHRRWNHKAHRGRQAQKRKNTSTRQRLQFRSFTHSNLLPFLITGTRRPIVDFDISQRSARLSEGRTPRLPCRVTFWPGTHVTHPRSENPFRELPIDIGAYQRFERESSLLIFEIAAFRPLLRQVSFFHYISE